MLLPGLQLDVCIEKAFDVLDEGREHVSEGMLNGISPTVCSAIESHRHMGAAYAVQLQAAHNSLGYEDAKRSLPQIWAGIGGRTRR